MQPSPPLEGNAATVLRLPTYAETRDSGVEWLGDVPAHWEVRRIKDWLRVNQTVLPEDTDPDYEFRYIDIGAVQAGVLIGEPVRMKFGSSPSRARRVLRVGDTIVSTVRTYLKAVWQVPTGEDDLVASTGFAVLTPRAATEPAFVGTLCRSQPFTDCVMAQSVGVAYPAIAETRFSAVPVAIPPPEEQTAIVRFLDYLDRRIRRYIRAKEKLIAALEEQKQAVIHQAVTGQIDVRIGRPYPIYRESGLDWLPEVPSHWTMKKLRQCASISGGMTPSMEDGRFWNGDVPWVTPKDMKTVVIDDSRLRVTDIALAETPLRLVQPPAVLMVVRGMILARRVPIARTTAPVTINQDMKALRPRTALNATYMASFLDCAHDGLFPLIDEAGHGTRRLPTERWRDLPIAIPPEAEQTAISRFVHRVTTTTTAATARARRQTAVLREWRERLIADVVTGKLDVREATTTLPER
ncbi:MAG: restriction endonuclease subunit S [Acidobacteria bacterium]|nr:restriction endonuclease subunit S [Acidobacteriota bacterium]